MNSPLSWLSSRWLRRLRRNYPWWPAAAVAVVLLGAGSVASAFEETDAVPAGQLAASVADPSGQVPDATVEPDTGGGVDRADRSGAGVPTPNGGVVAGQVDPSSVPFPAAGAVNPKSAPLAVPGLLDRPVAFPSAGALAPSPVPGAVPVTGAPAEPAAAAAVTNGQVYALIQRYFPATEWDHANRVSQCESGQRNVVSAPNWDGSRDHGVFQLNDGGTLNELLRQFGYASTDFARALDPDWNVRAAATLWQQRGWQPWTCASKLGVS